MDLAGLGVAQRGRGRHGRALRRARPGALAAALACALAAGHAAAHPLAPSLLELREEGGGRVLARLVSPRVLAAPPPRPLLPARCRPAGPARVFADGARSVAEQELDCGPAGLAGAELGADGLGAAGGQLVVRAVGPDGRARELLLHAGRERAVLVTRPDGLSAAAAYARLGAAHLATGLDHLLFVAGLLALVRPARRLAGTLTAFTAGHALTLGLVAAGAPAPSAALVEPAIAASLLALGLELAEVSRGAAPGPLSRAPYAMASAFGLLHGLGFAGALRGAGLPEASLPLAVGAFHAGIEAAQLAAVAAIAAAGVVLRRAPRGWAQPGAFAVGVGGLGAFLLIDRLAALAR